MGWLRGSKTSQEDDARRGLDADLEDFLQKQAPIKYEPSASKPSESTPKPSEKAVPNVQEQDKERGLPSDSLFQDGRYAHLWKNYKPQSEIEEAAKSDQEKLMDVLEGYKERKRSIGRIALENCALEQTELHDCYANGTVADRMVLCRRQRKAFDRCYTVQAQFLKTLGYLSTYDRPASVDEEIQMHADTLYHQMLDQEKAIADAKAGGLPEPDEQPINPATATFAKMKARLSGESDAKDEDLPVLSEALQDGLKSGAQLELRKRMKDLTPSERDVLQKEKLSEINVLMEVQRLRSSVLEDRKQRREEGKGTLGDAISGWLGW